ncbi:glycosyl transferase [Frondihabitans sp. PAMC 28766]|nr:glycosyl transferase [Frondihabitans sp. PAMC 28766]
MRVAERTAPVVVQQSFPRPRPTTNPYLVMLAESLASVPGVSVKTFSWRTALLSRADVFHVHWPEILVSGQSPVKKLVRQALTLLLVAKLAVTRTPIVRTLHNLERPTGISRREQWLLALIERRTALWIRLNDDTPVPNGRPSVVIPHGHYRDWYGVDQVSEPVEGRVAFVGLIRRYKGVETLIEAFRELPGDVSLHVSGRPSTPELAAALEALAEPDPRTVLTLRFVDDAELVREITESRLVVLPYREMHNSGGVLTALSLGRPVLVPANDVNRRLAAEVGQNWVVQYDGDLDPRDIERALAVAASPSSGARPDLSAREWDLAGALHTEAYRAALTAVRRLAS